MDNIKVFEEAALFLLSTSWLLNSFTQLFSWKPQMPQWSEYIPQSQSYWAFFLIKFLPSLLDPLFIAVATMNFHGYQLI